ncbi:MAG: response regulator [Bacteriovoracaceae bacterium]|nr:response regulator [Bacteriovoracaceae bacterium]
MTNKILVVDDNLPLLELLVLELSDEYIVDFSSCLEDAFLKVKSNIYSCIVLDIHLGKRNGGELVKYLIENFDNPNTIASFVIISGYITEEFVKNNSSKFSGMLMKPFKAEELNEKVKKGIADYEARVNMPTITEEMQESMNQRISLVVDELPSIIEDVKNTHLIDEILENVSLDGDFQKYFQLRTKVIIKNSLAICRALEWHTVKTMEKFIYASYLHDMAILHRPDLVRYKSKAELNAVLIKLDDSDRKLLVEHANIGAEAVRKYEAIPEDVSIMIKQHHELPNSKGYPNKLNSNKITPQSAVFIVAIDLTEAMILDDNFTPKRFIQNAEIKYKGAFFSKVILALKTVFKIK